MPRPLLHPERYQGAARRTRYFEGWYFKEVTADLRESWAFIPGISRGARRGEGCSFVQAIEGATGRSWWFEYPLGAFSASTRSLSIDVGRNHFGDEGFRLELSGPEGGFSGEVGFSGVTRPPSPPWAPGVMGPFSFVPFMECRHGLVSLRHGLSGSIRVQGPEGGAGRLVSFEGGRGYAEKDSGRSMPESWIWTQSNNFPDRGDSLMCSVARIPWLGSSFTGFLCVGSLGGRLVREATWTGARLASLSVGESSVAIAIERGGLRLELEAARSTAGSLRAPVDGLLSRRIAESVDALLRLRLLEGGRILFAGESPKAGLEVVGEAASLARLLPSAGKPT